VSIDDIRKYLTDNLRFNSQATRRRNANYLINRYFPGEVVHTDVIAFTRAAAGTPALGDALFYLTARTEKVVALVAEEVVFPSLAIGAVSRAKIRDFVQARFPSSKSANQIGVSVVATYQTFGVAHATRTKLDVCLREGSLAAFAYILHLEFPEPGMYSFERLLDGPMHKWLLWDQQWMVRQLYRLREVGLLSKVSEIDRMRQFTTKFPLAQAVQPIVALAKESST
jgi:DNA repair protein RadC